MNNRKIKVIVSFSQNSYGNSFQEKAIHVKKGILNMKTYK